MDGWEICWDDDHTVDPIYGLVSVCMDRQMCDCVEDKGVGRDDKVVNFGTHQLLIPIRVQSL
jgi:hypothetical protein